MGQGKCLYNVKVVWKNSECICIAGGTNYIYKHQRSYCSFKSGIAESSRKLAHFIFSLGWCLEHCTNDSVQYSVTEHFKSVEFGSSQSIPGVFFYYDISPVKVGNISTSKVFLKTKIIMFYIVMLELKLSLMGDDNLILFLPVHLID